MTTPRTILFWGHNPVLTSPDGELSTFVKKALKNGAQGIAVDPRRSETAARCRLWLPIRPGTDAALALAMIHCIIYDDLYDHDFVHAHTVGFERLKAHIKPFSPAWAEPVTGVSTDLIVEAARRYALDKPSVLEWGVAVEQTPHCLQTVRALALLRGITGNLDVPGADIFGASLLKPFPLQKSAMPPGMAKKRLGASEFKLLGGARAFLPAAHIPTVLTAMTVGKPYRVRALLNFGSNPLVTVANSRRVYEALSSLDFMVAADMFMTPTAAMADYVLPAAFWPEVDQLVELPYVAGNAVLAQQKVVTVGECRPDEEMLADLAGRMHLPGSEESPMDILNFRLSGLGIDFEELKKQGYVFQAPEYGLRRKNRFRTPSGKVELYSRSMERMGYDPLPFFQEPPESPVSRKDLTDRYPYVLITGSRRAEFFHSDNRQIPFLRQRRPHPLAELHTLDAAGNGIEDGDRIWITSPRGRIEMRAKVTDQIARGVVNIDHGWWFPEKQDTDFGVWESNANMLTSDEPPYDPGFGSYQLRALLCAVQKIHPQPDQPDQRGQTSQRDEPAQTERTTNP
jgi:anaerobic selenocysteine-containing dehydrogenase